VAGCRSCAGPPPPSGSAGSEPAQGRRLGYRQGAYVRKAHFTEPVIARQLGRRPAGSQVLRQALQHRLRRRRGRHRRD
jgi:hypothetical protein